MEVLRKVGFGVHMYRFNIVVSSTIVDSEIVVTTVVF